MNLIGGNPKIIVQPIKDFDKPDLHLLLKQKSYINAMHFTIVY